jgi:uncharacterized protein YjeT (DUF2065 family)
VLVIEGLFPFCRLRAGAACSADIAAQDGQLRFFGLCSILIGLACCDGGLLR